jgi:hypothetical protein
MPVLEYLEVVKSLTSGSRCFVSESMQDPLSRFFSKDTFYIHRRMLRGQHRSAYGNVILGIPENDLFRLQIQVSTNRFLSSERKDNGPLETPHFRGSSAAGKSLMVWFTTA